VSLSELHSGLETKRSGVREPTETLGVMIQVAKSVRKLSLEFRIWTCYSRLNAYESFKKFEFELQ
jgi:hypothetical protein